MFSSATKQQHFCCNCSPATSLNNHMNHLFFSSWRFFFFPHLWKKHFELNDTHTTTLHPTVSYWILCRHESGLAWLTPVVSIVTDDRQGFSPSFSCPLKISLSLHLQTSEVIFRCASVAPADPRTTLPSSLLSVWLPCQAEKKKKQLWLSAAEAPNSSFYFSVFSHPKPIYLYTSTQEHTLTSTQTITFTCK